MRRSRRARILPRLSKNKEHDMPGSAQKAGLQRLQNGLTPIGTSDWNYDFAGHLLERAGFGGTPEEIQALARMSPADAVRQLVYFQNIENNLPAFDHSGIHNPGLEPFPES